MILCTDLRADRTLKMAALKKTDGKMMIACSDELVAKEAYHHMTCYQSFIRDFLHNKIQKVNIVRTSLLLLKK